MGFATFIPLIAAAIQGGSQIAAAKLGGRGGGRSLLESLAPILQAEAQRRAALSEPVQTDAPDELLGTPGLDTGLIGGMNILELLKQQAFGGSREQQPFF